SSAPGMMEGSDQLRQGCSMSSLAATMVLNARPERGTTCSSMPPRRPTYSSVLSGSLCDSACATAIPGAKCPPVPPPAINTRMPYPSHLLVLGRNVHQYADRPQRYRQGGAPVADERQRDTGCRQGHRDRRDVDERLESDPGRHPAREQRAEGVGRFQRHPVTAISEERKQREDKSCADQPGLFADDGKDEVGMGKGQPLVFLNALPETHAGKASRS